MELISQKKGIYLGIPVNKEEIIYEAYKNIKNRKTTIVLGKIGEGKNSKELSKI